MSGRRTNRIVGRTAAVVVAALAALTVAPQAVATPPAAAGREVTVASYNLFLGGDIGTLVTAPDQASFFARAAALWQNVQVTDFPSRAEAIADLLVEDHPDVVGLQEVAKWEATSLGGPARSYDFLTLLLDALAERGAPYRVVATNTNFVSPVVPVPAAGVALRFTDRDVIIARADAAGGTVKTSNEQPHTFGPRITVALPLAGGVTVEIVRGWSTVDIKTRGATFRVANTHLEAFSGAVRNAQGIELAASLATSPHPVVLLGDLNSAPSDALPGAYGRMEAIGLDDAWVEAPGTGDGDTAGQPDSLTNVPSAIDHRIDYVLYDPESPGGVDVDAVESHVIGEELGDRTATVPPLWPSDHAGVVATLHLGQP